MKILQLVFIFILGVLLTFTMLFYELPFWLIFITIMLFYFLIQIGPQLHTVYWSNNLKRIERHLIKHKKNPLFALPLAIKTEDREKIMQAIQEVLISYKSPYIQEVYKTMLAVYEGNVSRAESFAKQISKEPLRSYYIAYVEVLKGNYEEARSIKDVKLKSLWMKHAIEALIAKEKGDRLLYEKEASLSISHAKGVQKYSLYYSIQHYQAV